MQIYFEDIRENLEINIKQVIRHYAVGLPWRKEMLSSGLKERSHLNISAMASC